MTSLAARINALPSRFTPAARSFLLCIFITGIVNAAWMLFFNIYILARGIDKEVLGLINAAPSISALVLGVPLGILADRMGKRQAMIAGLAAAVIGWLLQVTLVSPALIFITALLAGLGSTLFVLSQAPYMMEISDEDNRNMLFSLSYGMSILAGAAGNLFAGQLPTAFSGLLRVAADSPEAYRAVLVAAVAITALGILPLLSARAVHPIETTEQPRPRSGYREVFLRPQTLKLILPNLLLGFGAALLVGYFNVFYVEEWHLSDQSLGVLFSVMSFVVGIGTIAGPRMVPLFHGKVRAVIAMQVTGIVSLLVLGFSPILWLSELGLLVRGTAMMIAGALYSAFSMEKSQPEERGVVASLLNTIWQVGWAVGPFISGLVQVRYGFAPLFIATAVFYSSAVFTTWLFFRKEN
jgi:MFS family permease